MQRLKKVKFQAFRRQYKVMEMKNDEKVPEYLIRLMTLTNKMKNYGDVMVEEVVIEKVFRTLTPKIDMCRLLKKQKS